MSTRMPPHPGRYIADEMNHLDISLRALSRALRVAPSTIGRVIAGKAVITPVMAVKLSHVLGSTPEMWMRLQDAYSLARARQEVDTQDLTPLFENNRPAEHA